MPSQLKHDSFVDRHIGPSSADIAQMLAALGFGSLDELTASTVPAAIRHKNPLALDAPKAEHAVLAELRAIASKNRVMRSFIGTGYYDTITPAVILRNVLENPGWYTQYTPYQAEIAQGRLEALLNFQTMVADLCGMSLANASLLDEATAAAEAMTMCRRMAGRDDERNRFFVVEDNHPQTIAVVATRAASLGIEVVVGSILEQGGPDAYFGMLLAYPTTDGRLVDYRTLIERAHTVATRVVMATDLLALTLFTPPGELGADIAVGSSQRFGVPLGFGGPHAAFLATDATYSRHVPGRIVGQSKGARGEVAYRLFDLDFEERVGATLLRTWVKTRCCQEAWYHLEEGDRVSRVQQSYWERRLAARAVCPSS